MERYVINIKKFKNQKFINKNSIKTGGNVKMKKKQKKGFTLIELIVVVSIVLILSSILVPKVLGYQDKARKAKVVNTSRQIFDAAMESYTEDEGHLVLANLKKSITSVTDADVDQDSGITLANSGDQGATITFTSDKKTYNVAVTANNNRFEVKEKDGSEVIYQNKEKPKAKE